MSRMTTGQLPPESDYRHELQQKLRKQQQRIAELEQLLACEKTALEDEKAEHALTRAENQRLREKAKVFIDLYRESVHAKYWPEALKQLATVVETDP